MTDTEIKQGRTIVADLVASVGVRPLPVISEQASTEEVINAFADSIHTRLLYVLDGEGKLTGVISLGRLVRHTFNSYHEPKIHSRHLLNTIFSDTAQHLMQKETITALLSEDLDVVLQRMINSNAKEVAVLDQENRLVADLTMVDILRHYQRLAGSDSSLA